MGCELAGAATDSEPAPAASMRAGAHLEEVSLHALLSSNLLFSGLLTLSSSALCFLVSVSLVGEWECCLCLQFCALGGWG